MSGASQVSADVAALQGLNIDDLRKAWRERYGAPPCLRSAEVLRRLLAERLQLDAYGGDDVRNYERSGSVDLEAKLAFLVSGPAPAARPGRVLLREYGGKTHRVEVREADFAWEGRAFKSLSQIARQITGTRWNGPAFIGLRAEPRP